MPIYTTDDVFFLQLLHHNLIDRSTKIDPSIYIRHPTQKPPNRSLIICLLPDDAGVACVHYHNDERNQHYLDDVKLETNFDVV